MKKRTFLVSTLFLVCFALRSSAQVPASSHVFIVLEENHSYTSVIGNPAMPYFNSLANQHGLAMAYYADTHPSIGNYFMLTVGQIITNDDAFSGTIHQDNIVREILAAGKTYKSYEEDLPSVGYISPDVKEYVRHHCPLSYLSDVIDDPTQIVNLVPFTQFAIDLTNDALPDYSFIVPNTCHDAHDRCGGDPLAIADAWLQANIDPLIKSSVFQGDGILVLVFDESASTDKRLGGGHVAWVVVGPEVIPMHSSNVTYQHESTLRLMCEALGVTASACPGEAAMAPDMGEFFTTTSRVPVLLPAEVPPR